MTTAADVLNLLRAWRSDIESVPYLDWAIETATENA